MQPNRRIKQILGIVGSQALALGLMVLAASSLDRMTAVDEGAAAAPMGPQALVDCDDQGHNSAPAGTKDMDFLDLSIGWPRR